MIELKQKKDSPTLSLLSDTKFTLNQSYRTAIRILHEAIKTHLL